MAKFSPKPMVQQPNPNQVKTVGDLRKALEGLPDNATIQCWDFEALYALQGTNGRGFPVIHLTEDRGN